MITLQRCTPLNSVNNAKLLFATIVKTPNKILLNPANKVQDTDFNSLLNKVFPLTSQKFSDDSAIVGLITDGDDWQYREPNQYFVDWWLRKRLQIKKNKVTGGGFTQVHTLPSDTGEYPGNGHWEGLDS